MELAIPIIALGGLFIVGNQRRNTIKKKILNQWGNQETIYLM